MNFPKKLFCDICQILGHSTKECPYNLKTRSTQVLFTQGEQSTPPNPSPKKHKNNNNASLGGYCNRSLGTIIGLTIIVGQEAKFSTMPKEDP